MNHLVKYLLILIIPFAISCNKSDSDSNKKEISIRAADLSFLPEIEEEGTIYYDKNNNPKNALQIFKDNGCNTVRIRLWHTPANTHSSLAEVTNLANRVKALDMKVWLDIHYSDTWADPGTQTKPLAWNALDLTTLGDSVYNYTKKVVQIINPEYVQIGNEINSGFLWNDGKISNISNFILLLNKGIKAVRDVAPTSQIIIHFAGYKNAKWFYDQLTSNGVDYDIIGISHYPFWHGKNFDSLYIGINQLSILHNKPFVIAETAYPFSLGWNDYTNNTVGLNSQLISGYPANTAGQLLYLKKLKSIISKCNSGLGFCYWAPDWVAYKGSTATNGSSWENMALFDFNNKELAGMEVYNP